MTTNILVNSYVSCNYSDYHDCMCVYIYIHIYMLLLLVVCPVQCLYCYCKNDNYSSYCLYGTGE